MTCCTLYSSFKIHVKCFLRLRHNIWDSIHKIWDSIFISEILRSTESPEIDLLPDLGGIHRGGKVNIAFIGLGYLQK